MFDALLWPLGSSATYSPENPRNHTSKSASTSSHRRMRSNHLHVHPFTSRFTKKLLWDRLTSACISGRLSTFLDPVRGYADRSPRVRRVTFTPSPLHIRSIGLGGFRTSDTNDSSSAESIASYALRVPRVRVLHTTSFPPQLTMTQLLFR